MQTFLPYADFTQSAKILDWRRLGKQRVEAKQLMAALNGDSKGWVNHPAAVMWRGHDKALALYWLVMCQEWKARGYLDNLGVQAQAALDSLAAQEMTLPWWIGHEPFHASHRSNLLRKDPVHYGQFGWFESDDLEYLWPKADRSFVVGSDSARKRAALMPVRISHG